MSPLRSHPVGGTGILSAAPVARQLRLADCLQVADSRGRRQRGTCIQAGTVFHRDSRALDVRREAVYVLPTSPAHRRISAAWPGWFRDSRALPAHLALEIDTSVFGPPPRIRASTSAEHGLVGHRIGLAPDRGTS